MPRKLVFADVDNTMLFDGPKGQDIITQEVRRATRAMHEQKRLLVPSTSRPVGYMTELVVAASLHSYGILDGGATVYNFKVGQVIEEFSSRLEPEQTQQAVDLLSAADCLEVYYDTHETGQPRKRLPRQLGNTAVWAPAVFSVIPASSEADLLAAFAAMPGYKAVANTSDKGSGFSTIQIFRPEAGKGNAAKRLLAGGVFGEVDSEDMAAIGDGRNDEELFDAMPPGGLKIAMGDAHPDLLARADVTVPAARQDGFAVAADKYFISV